MRHRGRYELSLTAFLVVVLQLAVSVSDTLLNTRRKIDRHLVRVARRHVVVIVIDARRGNGGTGVLAVETTISFVPAGEGFDADASAFAAVATVVT